MPGLRLLLAEDDADVALGFEMMLRGAGYDIVDVARDGAEAVDKAHRHRPDLVLMDIKMPRMDGLEAARAINQDRVSNLIPIVLVTAFADRPLIERAKYCGVLGYLIKPVQLEDLISSLELAHATAQRISTLEGAVDNLAEELEARRLVERAKGILMKQLGIDEEEAMKRMQQESRRLRLKLKQFAQAIIAASAGEA